MTDLGLKNVPAQVEQHLEAFFNERAAAVETIGEPVAQAVSHLRRFVLGGGMGLVQGASLRVVTERVRIPMLPARRSLNLANAASIAVYEAWRQHGYAGS